MTKQCYSCGEALDGKPYLRLRRYDAQGFPIGKGMNLCNNATCRRTPVPQPRPGREPFKPVRGSKLSHEHYERVAAAYMDIVNAGGTKTSELIAERFGVSRSTAGTWLVDARKMGVLTHGSRQQASV